MFFDKIVEMLSLVKTKCDFCRKQFLTKRAYFIFNQNNDYHSFCSKKCHYKSRIRGKILSCENPKCNKRFYRAPNNISLFNYCSKSCAAIVNNQKYPKWSKRYCTKCGKEFKNRESKYCSSECGWSAFKNHLIPKYSSEEIQKIIKKLAKKLGRSPARRELGNLSHTAIRAYGSWNNAVIAAGLKPHRSDDNRMYRRTKIKAHDGHLCDSVSEAIIDNWLTQNKISHTRDTKYPTTNHRADWAIKDSKVFIEYFGLAKDSPRYDRAVKEKIKLCHKNKIKLIEIYPKDLYPSNQLDKVLNRLI